MDVYFRNGKPFEPNEEERRRIADVTRIDDTSLRIAREMKPAAEPVPDPWLRLERSIAIKAGLHKKAIRDQAQRARMEIDRILGARSGAGFAAEELRDFGLNIINDYFDGTLQVIRSRPAGGFHHVRIPLAGGSHHIQLPLDLE